MESLCTQPAAEICEVDQFCYDSADWEGLIAATRQIHAQQQQAIEDELKLQDFLSTLDDLGMEFLAATSFRPIFPGKSDLQKQLERQN